MIVYGLLSTQIEIHTSFPVFSILNFSQISGEKVLCGDSIRLEHVLTRRNLHSYDFQSPASDRSEVSCFGEGGNGDGGICKSQQRINENR